jgi:hypothetical protein
MVILVQKNSARARKMNWSPGLSKTLASGQNPN